MIGNHAEVYNELHARANDLEKRIKEAIDGKVMAMGSVLHMMDYKITQYNEKIEEPLKQFVSNITKDLGAQDRRTKNVLDQMRVEVKEQVNLTFAEYQAVFESRYNESIKKLKEYVDRY
eukprot:3041599-Lingulodinium_polyedra.AAC.1